MTNADQRVVIYVLLVVLLAAYTSTYRREMTRWLRWRASRPTFHSGSTWPREREAWLNRRPGRRTR